MNTLLLIDGHSLLHRAFHALPPLTTASGEPVGALFGFSRMLLSVVLDRKPDCLVVAWDTPAATFRHSLFADYKQHRPETDQTLRQQIEKAKDIAAAFGCIQFSTEGYEADDVIGTLADSVDTDWQVQILSSDMDLLQLVNGKVHVLATKKGISQLHVYDRQAVKERCGLSPEQVPDLKGLMGDSSDNIPGVRGIGEKTATKLLQQYGSLENVYGHIDEITGKTKELLANQHEQAVLSKQLATIRRDAPATLDWERCKECVVNFDALVETFKQYGFNSLLGQLNRLNQNRKNSDNVGSKPLEVSKTSTSWQLVDDQEVGTWLLSQQTLYGLRSDDSLYFFTPDEKYWLLNTDHSLPQTIADLLGQKKIIGYDVKSMLHTAAVLGFTFEPFFDLQIADTVVSYGKGSKDCGEVVFKQIGIVLGPGSEAIPEWLSAIVRVHAVLQESLAADAQLQSIFQDIEMPLVSILYQMEHEGILVDREVLESKRVILEEKISQVERTIFQKVGHELNLNSPKQLEEVLFDELSLPVVKRTKTQRSTNEYVLQQLSHLHPVPKLMLEYRSLTKIQSTYLVPFLALTEKEKRIHTRYNQLKTITGRLSSEEPNLQNIPRDKGVGLRSAFVAESGHQLMALDYSQIELRILAHLSGEQHLQESFRKEQDIHAVTAARLFDTFVTEVTDRQRQIGKTINFAVMYGMGPHALSQSLDIEYVQAKNYIDEFFEFYPHIKAWQEQTITFGKEHGYVETMWGRKMAVPELASGSRPTQAAGERMATNYPNQGTQADLIKKAMGEIHEYLRKNNLSMVKLLLQVHDELVFELPNELVAEVAPNIKQIMEQIITLDVPVVVDCKAGNNWQETEDIKT